MANANLTVAHRQAVPEAEVARQFNPEVLEEATAKADDAALSAILTVLKALDDEQVVTVLDAFGTPGLERYLLLTMHQLVRAPSGDETAQKLADVWFRAMPGLITVEGSTRKLVEWTDSTAEAYTAH